MQWYRKMTARPILQKRRNILKLISLYRAKRVLWDRSNARYTDQPTRKAAWRDISSRFPCSVEELKLKMTSLLKAYDREMKKEMCPLCARKGDCLHWKEQNNSFFGPYLHQYYLRNFIVVIDPREVYRSKWFAYNSFDFLRKVPPRIRGPNKVGPSIWDSDNVSNRLVNISFSWSCCQCQLYRVNWEYWAIQGVLVWWTNLRLLVQFLDCEMIHNLYCVSTKMLKSNLYVHILYKMFLLNLERWNFLGHFFFYFLFSLVQNVEFEL